MDDLVQWLRAQLHEDERAARRAADYDDGAAHDIHGPPGTWACLDESEWFGPSYRGGVIAPRIGNVNAPELGAHIVAHDPARVLREIDAKRQMLAIHRSEPNPDWDRPGVDGRSCTCCITQYPCPTLRLLALPYVDLPGYRDEWRP